MAADNSSGVERRLLREIGALADRVRALRAAPAPRDHHAIKSLEDQARAKWQELRSARGGSRAQEPPDHRRSSLYR